MKLEEVRNIRDYIQLFRKCRSLLKIKTKKKTNIIDGFLFQKNIMHLMQQKYKISHVL